VSWYRLNPALLSLIEKALVRKKGPAKVNPDESTQERLVIHEKKKGKNKNGIKNKAANV
jgi:hypothetical protein